MWTELAVLGGIMGVFVGLLEVSHRLAGASPGRLTPEAALQDALRGPDGGAVRAEFRRRGIEPVGPRHPVGFQV